MTEVLMEQGIKEVAVTYTNNDYGKGLADSFAAAFEAAGGTVTINASHEDGKADYSAEVGALAAAGGDRLVVAGYVDQGGSGIVRAALDSGAEAQAGTAGAAEELYPGEPRRAVGHRQPHRGAGNGGQRGLADAVLRCGVQRQPRRK